MGDGRAADLGDGEDGKERWACDSPPLGHPKGEGGEGKGGGGRRVSPAPCNAMREANAAHCVHGGPHGGRSWDPRALAKAAASGHERSIILVAGRKPTPAVASGRTKHTSAVWQTRGADHGRTLGKTSPRSAAPRGRRWQVHGFHNLWCSSCIEHVYQINIIGGTPWGRRPTSAAPAGSRESLNRCVGLLCMDSTTFGVHHAYIKELP